MTAAHETQHNSFFFNLMFAVLSLGSFYCNSLYQRQTAKAFLLLKTQHLGFRKHEIKGAFSFLKFPEL